MNKFPFFIFLLFVFEVQACETLIVPIEIVNPYNNTPRENSESIRLIVAPIEYDGWKLNGASYYQNKNIIPLGHYEDSKKYPGKAIFEFLGTLDLYTDSYIVAVYTPLAVKHKDGSLTFNACLHTQRVDWNI